MGTGERGSTRCYPRASHLALARVTGRGHILNAWWGPEDCLKPRKRCGLGGSAPADLCRSPGER